jgi:hypothetical protein
MHHLFLRRAALTLFALALFALPTAAYAQDGESASAPAGIGALILLLGIAALLAVGGFYMSANRAVRRDERDETAE